MSERAVDSSPAAPGAASVRVSCDSLVALAPRTRRGRTIFAKNSDRPALECQTLHAVPAAHHPEGSRLRCQYVSIDQVPETLAFVGARPSWLWGLEHGVNERGVAIGNHTIFTKDPVAESGLLGMDLVRLGLERAATAEDAVEVIVELLETYGQGGSGYADTQWPYHNSFLVADAGAAFLLEASASHWAVRRAETALAASNHASIGTDWERVGHDTIEHAIARGWWQEPTTGARFDFAAAYRSMEIAPPVISSGRYATTTRALAGGDLDVDAVKRVLRDHYGAGECHRPGATPEQETYFSVCMHADPVGTTTASMVVELDEPGAAPSVVWMALTSPCIAPFLPVFVGAELPAELERGGSDPRSGGAWWRFKALLAKVEEDFASRGPLVRSYWAPIEEEIAAMVRAGIADLPPQRGERRAAETALMLRAWTRVSGALDDLVAKL